MSSPSPQSPHSLAELSRRFPGKRAFITGAGGGLGLEIARVMASDGWVLGLFDADPSRLNLAEEELTNSGARVLAYPGDVTHFDELVVAVNSFVAVSDGLDVMINNAGVACAGSLLETSLEDWRWIVDINLLGVINGCRAGVPHLQRAGRGVLINVSSAAAFVCAPFMAPYNATKAAVVAVSESLSAELGSMGIQVSVAMPGFMQTELLATARGPDREKEIAAQLMKNSRYTATQCAHDMLQAAGKRKLYIVLPKAMHRIWRLKRWFPNWFVRQFPHLRERLRSKSK
jgi:NAD(P)-dependent dehydrogenase (short-subunit alcohol dehydrogenase family)